MENDRKRGKSILKAGGYTCVLCRGERVFTSTERGIRPLLAWLDGKEDLRGFCAADKVVGKAAAFLYVLLGVKAVYAFTMSRAAMEIFAENGIACQAEEAVREIRNRTNTGLCPMEEAVKDTDTPSEALGNIRRKLLSIS